MSRFSLVSNEATDNRPRFKNHLMLPVDEASSTDQVQHKQPEFGKFLTIPGQGNSSLRCFSSFIRMRASARPPSLHPPQQLTPPLWPQAPKSRTASPKAPAATRSAEIRARAT